jgi:tetratricopeptide (TPR) repeat protein
MKKLLLAASLILAAFGLIAIVRRRAAEKSPAQALADADKQRIRIFWESYNRANALRLQGAFTEAASAYRESLRLNPKHEDSLYYLGACLEELGNYPEAAAAYRKLIEVNPSSGRALSELGNVLSLMAPGAPADFNEARAAYLRCIEVNREQAGPFLRLGMLELNQGHPEAALRNFRVAAGFGSPEGNFLLAYTLFLQRKYQEAVQPLRKVLEVYARERRITARGVLSEGDILPAPGKPLSSALEKASVKSMLLLYWVSQQLGGYPAAIPKEFQVQKPPASGSELQPIAAKAGLGTSGGRAAWADFDRDGALDLLVVGAGLPVALYHQQEGKLLDVSRSAGLEGVYDVWDTYWVDYDHDGYPDLYFIRSGLLGTGQNALYHNNRDGTFTDVTASMGLQGERSTARACFADLDGDGRTDLLEVGASDATHSSVRFFRNAGNRFIEQTQAAGLTRAGTAVDCAVGDFNRDGRPDVFVLNWRQEAVLYANQGNGRFADVTRQAGLGGIRIQAFSALFFDYDRDGFLDLLVTSHAPFEEVARCLLQPGYTTAQNTPRLFHNRGNGTFEEVTQQAGLNRCYGTMQALVADVDSDGWPDLLLVNGSLDGERLEPSVVLRNLQGKRFREWFYVPSYGHPSNFIGGAVAEHNFDGTVRVFFGRNPILQNAGVSAGLFVHRMTDRPRTSPTSGD